MAHANPPELSRACFQMALCNRASLLALPPFSADATGSSKPETVPAQYCEPVGPRHEFAFVCVFGFRNAKQVALHPKINRYKVITK